MCLGDSVALCTFQFRLPMKAACPCCLFLSVLDVHFPLSVMSTFPSQCCLLFSAHVVPVRVAFPYCLFLSVHVVYFLLSVLSIFQPILFHVAIVRVVCPCCLSLSPCYLLFSANVVPTKAACPCCLFLSIHVVYLLLSMLFQGGQLDHTVYSF